MKQMTIQATCVIAAAMMMTSCGNSTTTTTTTTDSASTMQAKVDTAMSTAKNDAQMAAAAVKNEVAGNADSNFVVKAAATNAGELRILQAGMDKGTDKELKGHLKMMIADHKKMGDKVKAYATKKNYPLPAGDEGKADDELKTLADKTKGKDFDKELTDHLVSAHKDVIDMFESRQKDTKDADLKAIVDGALPTLHSHLDMMKGMQDKMGK